MDWLQVRSRPPSEFPAWRPLPQDADPHHHSPPVHVLVPYPPVVGAEDAEDCDRYNCMHMHMYAYAYPSGYPGYAYKNCTRVPRYRVCIVQFRCRGCRGLWQYRYKYAYNCSTIVLGCFYVGTRGRFLPGPPNPCPYNFVWWLGTHGYPGTYQNQWLLVGWYSYRTIELKLFCTDTRVLVFSPFRRKKDKKNLKLSRGLGKLLPRE